ncbi:MAG: Type II/IV secretion system protein TadC, associated with Flp pilus assembly [uncultured Solirubrobacteraceae bacterium]|uniref:Type II/IV secretion system protein TadC, associated with Flp pilus assembly n=1 Tax=uncultured Solirubrobacteraceae bacterium TaxID=1162706 RepID=A0A6J4T1A0_9ACTN|nr:MAG: Type II/IV secretion system protein TadC, associated with Flp pilus assembly [uncultured Solirubrobacteraceae bacterium]
MIITLLLGLALLGFAAALAARALTFGRVEANQRLRSIEMYGFRPSENGAEAAVGSGIDLNNIAERLGKAAIKRFGNVDAAKTRRELLGAGFYSVTVESYLGFRIMATATLTALLLLIAVSAPSVLMFLGVIVGGLLGWRLPMVVVQRRAKARYDEIDRELPELVDLLVVSIEAGVGLAGALQMMASRMHGPLGIELRFMQHEQSMGLSSDHALTKLLDRVDTPSVRSFVRSLQQGERLGVSIGAILRNLAVEMRSRRRQLAEERAQKAPVKILFPLVFLIFPAIFIVLLGPAVFALKDAFG